MNQNTFTAEQLARLQQLKTRLKQCMLELKQLEEEQQELKTMLKDTTAMIQIKKHAINCIESLLIDELINNNL